MPTRCWKAEPCPCGHASCRSWLVRPVVMLQGAIDNEADARLIAAAPELADALDAALNWFSGVGNRSGWSGAGDPDLDAWRAVLAKARGEG